MYFDEDTDRAGETSSATLVLLATILILIGYVLLPIVESFRLLISTYITGGDEHLAIIIVYITAIMFIFAGSIISAYVRLKRR